MARGEKVAKWIVGGVLLAILALAIWGMVFRSEERVRVHVGDGIFSMRLADTEETRQKGLSGVRALPETEGMLFVYEKADRHGIWMRDMHINLDIIWLDANKRVIHVVKNASPDTHPQIFRPEKPARYVLELNAGMVDKRSIAIGKEARFELSAEESEK